MGGRVEVEMSMKASASELYAMVGDVTRMGEWSPETAKCVWVGGADGPAVGARFRGENVNGSKRWSITSEVVAADPGAHFAFDPKVGPLTYARWGYEFEPDGEFTTVTEYWIDRRGPVTKWAGKFVSGVADREGHNRQTMTATLERLKAAVEAESA